MSQRTEKQRPEREGGDRQTHIQGKRETQKDRETQREPEAEVVTINHVQQGTRRKQTKATKPMMKRQTTSWFSDPLMLPNNKSTFFPRQPTQTYRIAPPNTEREKGKRKQKHCHPLLASSMQTNDILLKIKNKNNQ